MIAFDRADTLAGAFIAGLVTSVHCVGMCGLFTCGLGLCSGQGRLTSLVGYHGARLGAYLLVGMIAGALGFFPITRWLAPVQGLVPWLLALMLLAVAFGWERWLGAAKLPLWFRGHFSRIVLPGGGAAPRGWIVGGLTPLLPCAPLYALFAVCLATGSTVRGAELGLAFGMGTVPLLWAGQFGWGALANRNQSGQLKWIQRGLALVAAGVLMWRFRGMLPWVEGPASCCHG
ncbi:MAG: sulfite exporter TauE/SafE family protein [Verrucomicrobiales bacterium]|nr:sulfite exporter TauE/SafE family protein [Verrucomicrobiales bacterium]